MGVKVWHPTRGASDESADWPPLPAPSGLRPRSEPRRGVVAWRTVVSLGDIKKRVKEPPWPRPVTPVLKPVGLCSAPFLGFTAPSPVFPGPEAVQGHLVHNSVREGHVNVGTQRAWAPAQPFSP